MLHALHAGGGGGGVMVRVVVVVVVMVVVGMMVIVVVVGRVQGAGCRVRLGLIIHLFRKRWHEPPRLGT